MGAILTWLDVDMDPDVDHAVDGRTGPIAPHDAATFTPVIHIRFPLIRLKLDFAKYDYFRKTDS